MPTQAQNAARQSWINTSKSANSDRLEECPFCNNSFGFLLWRYKCSLCGTTICDDCLKQASISGINRVCNQCYEHLSSLPSDNLDSVSTWTSNYQGKIHHDASDVEIVSSNFHRDRDDAIKELKLIALTHGFSIVFNIKFNKSTDSETSDSGRGTHKYTIWQACGIAGNR